MTDIILETINVCKSFERPGGIQKVLDNVNLKIHRGEVLAVRGKSGNGKSTLLNIMSATLMADSGSVLYREKDLQKRSNTERANYRRENIGYIPQNLYLLDDRNVFMNIALPLQYAKIQKHEIRKSVEEVAEWFDIKFLLDKEVRTLSRGEKQRVAICRAIVKKADILFADEPTGSLDEENEQLVLEMFRHLKEQGTAIVIATHDDLVTKMCDSVHNVGSLRQPGSLGYAESI